ncbi:MAG: hypothetical protein M0Z79_02040 [Nitrospiraceae bacterium]|nr:hypothetical protein [Nitrospiraceae bacterium]
MLLHPGIIGLVIGSGLTLLLLFSAAGLGIQILGKWDITSNSELQLGLERKTYLVSTLVQYALLFQVISAFLFIYTADDMHNLLVGAMCATGSLNANPYGFPALCAQIATLFLAAAWISLNRIDNQAEDYPLTRKKYGLLFLILPAVSAGYVLQLKYFSSIDPDIITSCCGVLFSEGGPGLGSSLSSLPIRRMEAAFGLLYLLVLVSGLPAARSGSRPFTLLLSASSALFFFGAIASVISFISLYFYQLPSHHCPFDILQAGYYYVGYPLYAALFSGCFFGVMTGAVEPFRKIPSLAAVIPAAQRKWALAATVAITLFVILSMVPIVFTPFTLEGY